MNRAGRRTKTTAHALVAVFLLGLITALLAAMCAQPAHAGQVERVLVPERSAIYRHRVEQAAARVWGVESSPARLAAQLHQESAWRSDARSHAGAQGIAQFMPATARWMSELFRAELGSFDPWNPQQAIMAAALYDKWLLDRVQPIGHTRLTDCSRWNFALRGYNGGELWLLRERGMTVAGRANPNSWEDVQKFRARGPSAHRENTAYPRRILLVLEPAYIAAGWPGQAVC